MPLIYKEREREREREGERKRKGERERRDREGGGGADRHTYIRKEANKQLGTNTKRYTENKERQADRQR